MTDPERIADHADRVLQLATSSLSDEYYYGSLSLCLIDAVYSIGVRYEGVRAVVRRYCDYFGLDLVRPSRQHLPPQASQESISLLCSHFRHIGPERMATDIFRNRQRTSTRHGILKAEAIAHFADVLIRHGIEYLQDIGSTTPAPALEQAVATIPGQGSGISLQYFWMLAGSDDLIKPDRMIIRFLHHVLGRRATLDECQLLLTEAAALLRTRHPHLTPRLLDYQIWQHQRQLSP